ATISLAPGTFTSANGEVNNIGIAEGTTINTAIGGTGNDTFLASAGTHTFNGNGGTNKIVFTGSLWQYLVTQNAGASVTVADLRSNSPDGTTTGTNVQSFQFAGGTYSFTTLPDLVVSSITPTATTVVQGGVFSYSFVVK